ncbi:unnamed protein product [Leptosia nina]|uniref:Uncharacterized protein n=1 Tax=Leptosia nina TaxID=320188 RepID=A0AAV1K344_9NEOP
MRTILIVVLLTVYLGNVWAVPASFLIPGITTTSTTTRKPWTTKVKDGISTFFQGAAAASVVQQAIQNGKSSKRKTHHTEHKQ